MARDEILAALRERIKAFAASHYQRDAAEDIAQDVMVVLQERYSHLDSLIDLVPLSMKIARFRMLSLRRKAVRRGEVGQISVDDVFLADSGPDAEQLAEREQLAQRLSAALNGLGGRCREIFRLKLQGLSFPDIQSHLGAANINTVYTWEARCRKQLQSLIGGGTNS